jgi:hypothetical protein
VALDSTALEDLRSPSRLEIGDTSKVRRELGVSLKATVYRV